MQKIEIIQLNPEDFCKCINIWDIHKNPEFTSSMYKQLLSGNRITYIYTINGTFIAEGSLLYDREDPDYTIQGQRIYFSRLVVKEEYRNQGIGGILVDFLVDKATELGFSEISIGVDKSNEVALRLYKGKGFTEIIFEGEDEHGEYYKLLKRLDKKDP